MITTVIKTVASGRLIRYRHLVKAPSIRKDASKKTEPLATKTISDVPEASVPAPDAPNDAPAKPKHRRPYESMPLMAPKDLARFLNVSLSTLRRMYLNGDLPKPAQCGGGLRFVPAEVVERLRKK